MIVWWLAVTYIERGIFFLFCACHWLDVVKKGVGSWLDVWQSHSLVLISFLGTIVHFASLVLKYLEFRASGGLMSCSTSSRVLV